MKKYKYLLHLAALCFLVFPQGLIAQEISFESVETFYPNWEASKADDLEWGHLLVPENWEATSSNQIKVGVVILKNTSKLEHANATVFIQGGPGASGISTIDMWMQHPIRKTNDVVIVDVRGTGFSEPRLCPDLGKQLLGILAKNQTLEADEKDKTNAALACKKELLIRGVDVAAYHSVSVAKDLNALKTHLGYQQWNVYGVSYGTYMAQVYASTFPTDVRALILDSSVADISDYYTQNTDNYMTSLQRVFEKCKNDPTCDAQYPDLENVFYNTIEQLKKEPIEVGVSKRLVETESFTYNAEDFKVAIQQALYHKQLVEILPLLIYQFHNQNSEALGNLVAAFSSLLRMDYGLYYCVSCNEVLPNNDAEVFAKETAKYPRLQGALSFYQSDFKVCDKWNLGVNESDLQEHNLAGLEAMDAPVMIFAGEFDPITPATNGAKVATNFSNASVLDAHTYGHVPSFTLIGNKLTSSFVDQPTQTIDLASFDKAPALSFAKNIKLNAGVSTMGKSLNRLDPFFIVPLAIALFLMLGYVIHYIVRWFRGQHKNQPDRVVKGLSLITSLLGIAVLIGFVLAVIHVSSYNYYILAFGLPNDYSYLFTGLLVFIGFLLLTAISFFMQLKKIKQQNIMFSILFSQLVFAIYFMYWGVI